MQSLDAVGDALKYQRLFEGADISILEQDFSQVYAALEGLREQGIVDLRRELQEHPELTWELAAKVKIKDVNQHTLQVFGARSKQELLTSINQLFTGSAIETFADELCAIWARERTFRAEVSQRTLDGRELSVLLSMPIPRDQRDFASVPVSILDITDRKNAEEALRASEEQLRLITDNLPVLISYIDLGLCYRFVNKTAATWYGRPQEAVIGKPVREIFGSGPFETVRPRVERVLSGEAQNFEETLEYPDGKTRQSQISYIPHIGEDGRPRGFFGLVQDISDRKRAEDALYEREMMLNAVIENVPVSLSLKDREGRFTLVNPGFEQLHQVAADEVLEKTFFDILPHEIAADAAAEDRQVLETGEALRTDYAWPAHLGFYHELIYKFPLRAQRGGPITGVGVIALDVTDQKRAEIELRESEERLTQAVQLAKLGHCIWDSTHDRCLYCSDEYASVHGVAADEYIAQASTGGGVFNHPDDREAYREAIARLRRGRGFEMEYRVVTPDGEVRHVREVAKPVLDKSGQVVQEVCTIQDITELKEAETRLAQAQKMEAVGQLTGGVAHDFNNLLAIIQGNAELLAGEQRPDAGAIDSILRASARGAELTQRLLAFSRQQPLRPQTIDLGTLATGMSGLWSRTLGETIEIEINADPSLWAASADPSQVENALLNLALNARDAMPEGGKLTIEGGNAQLDDAYVRENPEAKAGDYVVLAVSDSGSGMTPEVRARAFEPFFTTKQVGQGSGLGLSMVYGFTKQSGGHVSIYSEEGRGTTVKIYLPRNRAAAADEQTRRSDAVPSGRGETILVIEDDPDVRAMAVRMLEGLSYRVIDAPDAASADKILRDGQPVDLVLSDVVLPGGTSGPDFAEAAREAYPDIKIIFMSGYPAEAARRNGFLESGNVLLNKPFHRQQLAAALREALD